MNNPEINSAADWQKGNAEYLSATMAWLRACLEQACQQQASPDPYAPAQPTNKISAALPTMPIKDESQPIWRRFPRPAVQPPLKITSTSSEVKPQTDQRVAQAVAAMQAAANVMDPPPALMILVQRLRLSAFEQQVLTLCLGMELDPAVAGLCARCQKDAGRAYPTFALAFSLFEGASWDALSPERPLRYWRLIEITQLGGQPLTASALRVDERIVNYIKGLNYLDDRLQPLLSSIDVHEDDSNLPPSHRESVETILRTLKLADANRSLPVVQLLGADTASKELIASTVTTSIGLQLYRLPAILLPAQPADIETLARLWQRESLLLPLALYLDTLGSSAEATAGSSAGGLSSSITRLLERMEGAIFLDTREGWPGLHRLTLTVDAAKPTTAEQAAIWQTALGPSAGSSPARMAAQFNLSYSAIRQLAQDVLSQQEAPTQPDPKPQPKTPATQSNQTKPLDQVQTTQADQDKLHDQLWGRCLVNTRPQLDALAERVKPRSTWDEIVLPPAESDLLHQIAKQVAERTLVYETWGFAQKMSRGLGISALFSGDSGTGKTMAAEVIANDLHLNLYRIDLSAVVSKYIGETEKNLRRMFDAAENGGAILFFDEADALFGKRSEVKDSHDRYANIEINYLLQRIEAYRGLAILATNMKSSLDTAFLRRLRFVVNFPFPGVAQRKEIWERAFPKELPKETLDYDRLARLNVVGGHIHNIALNAAFLAAQAKSSVTMPLIFEAAKIEFRKIERPINEADFRWTASQAAATVATPKGAVA